MAGFRTHLGLHLSLVLSFTLSIPTAPLPRDISEATLTLWASSEVRGGRSTDANFQEVASLAEPSLRSSASGKMWRELISDSTFLSSDVESI